MSPFWVYTKPKLKEKVDPNDMELFAMGQTIIFWVRPILEPNQNQDADHQRSHQSVDDQTCAICLGSLNEGYRFTLHSAKGHEDGTVINHDFHFQCIYDALSHSSALGGVLCPICRSDVSESPCYKRIQLRLTSKILLKNWVCIFCKMVLSVGLLTFSARTTLFSILGFWGTIKCVFVAVPAVTITRFFGRGYAPESLFTLVGNVITYYMLPPCYRILWLTYGGFGAICHLVIPPVIEKVNSLFIRPKNFKGWLWLLIPFVSGVYYGLKGADLLMSLNLKVADHISALISN